MTTPPPQKKSKKKQCACHINSSFHINHLTSSSGQIHAPKPFWKKFWSHQL